MTAIFGHPLLRLFSGGLVVLLATQVVGKCEEFAVSPKPIVFTEHPRGTVANAGDEVHLRCTANVEQIGGFQIVRDSIRRYGRKGAWRQYRICWMYQPLDERTIEYCSSRGDLTVSSSSTGGDEMVSELKFLNASAASSGFYSCYIEDWRTRYSSYPAYVQVGSDGTSIFNNRSMIAVTMGDMAEVNCGLPLNDSDSLTWFHNGRKLTVPSDRYSSPSLVALRFKVLSVEDEGTYECVSPLGGSHSVQLILFQAMTGSTAGSPLHNTVYQGASGSNVALTLDCQKDPHNAMDDVWYEWYINGIRSNKHSSSMEAADIQSYVCYTHYQNTSLSIVHRVLPKGCVNPVVGLEYPTVDVEVHNETHFTSKVKFCWNKPDHLGGLNEDEIRYRVVFKNLDTPTSPLENLTLNSLCYEGMFTTMSEITTLIDIEVSAVPNTMDQTEPSRATVFPKTSLIGWRKLQIKEYCNEARMRLEITEPMKQLLDFPSISMYQGRYHCLDSTKVTKEILSQQGYSLFDYLYERISLFGHLNGFKFLSSNSIGWDKKGEWIIDRQQRKSCAALVYTNFREGKWFDPHVDFTDYSICNFEDPPKVQFVTEERTVQRGHKIAIHFVIVNTSSRGIISDFELHLKCNSTDPQFGDVSKTLSSGTISKDNTTGVFLVDLQDLLSQSDVNFLNFTLSIPEQYDNIVELGNITIVRLEITEPVPVPTSPLPTVLAGVASFVFLLLLTVAMVMLACTCSFRLWKLRMERRMMISKLSLQNSTHYWKQSMDIEQDTLTQYEYDWSESFGKAHSDYRSTAKFSSSTNDSAFVDDGNLTTSGETHETDTQSTYSFSSRTGTIPVSGYILESFSTYVEAPLPVNTCDASTTIETAHRL